MTVAFRIKLVAATVACFAYALCVHSGPAMQTQALAAPALATAACMRISPSTPVGDQPRIAAQARAWIGCYDGDFGAPCEEACVVTVNHVVYKAIQRWLGNDPTVNNTDILKANGGIVLLAKQSDAVPGDFMIVDSKDGKNAHIGICLDTGCTNVISNGSSTCKFIFESAHNARFTYPGSPYIGGIAGYYRATKPGERSALAGSARDVRYQTLSPLPVYATPKPSVVEDACITKGSDMKLRRWVYAKGHLLCATADQFTGGQQLYTETTAGKFVLSSAGGGSFRPADLIQQPPPVRHVALVRRPLDPATAVELVSAMSAR